MLQYFHSHASPLHARLGTHPGSILLLPSYSSSAVLALFSNLRFTLHNIFQHYLSPLLLHKLTLYSIVYLHLYSNIYNTRVPVFILPFLTLP